MTIRFEGEAGRRRLIDLLREQKMVRGSEALAEELSKLVEVKELKAGEVLIEEGADDTDMYFILDGVFEVFVSWQANRATGSWHTGRRDGCRTARAASLRKRDCFGWCSGGETA